MGKIKDQAMDYFVRIPDGHKNAIQLPGDPVDEKELDEYLAKELHRARAIQLKRLCMKKTFEGWRDSAAYANHFRQARQSERLHSSLPGKPTSGSEPEGEERKQGIG